MKTSYQDPFKSVLNSMFEKPFQYSNGLSKITEKEDSYLVYMSVPGLTKEDLKISIKEGLLNISYKKGEENKNFTFMNTFNKTYLVPDNVDEKEISGKVENGVLEISLPKSKKKPIEHYIELR